MPNAVAALTSPKTAKLAAAIKAEWAQIKAAPNAPDGFVAVADPTKTFVCGDATIGFGNDGSITTLQLKSSGSAWASPSAKLAQLWYQAMVSNVDNFIPLPLLLALLLADVLARSRTSRT